MNAAPKLILKRPPFWTLQMIIPSKVSTVKMVCSWSVAQFFISVFPKVELNSLIMTCPLKCADFTSTFQFNFIMLFTLNMIFLLESHCFPGLIFWVRHLHPLSICQNIVAHFIVLERFFLPLFPLFLLSYISACGKKNPQRPLLTTQD